MDFSPLIGIIDFMLKDKMTVKRLMDITDPNTGLTKQDYFNVEGYENIPCKISFGSTDNATVPANNNDSNPYSINPQLFYSLNHTLKKGDKISVDIIGNKGEVLSTINAICGESKVYQLYKQTELSVEEA